MERENIMEHNLGKLLNKVRREKLLSLRDLSDKMKLGENGHIYLSNIECGRILPDIETLKNILNALNSIDRLEEFIEELNNAKINNDYDDKTEYEEKVYFKTLKGKRKYNRAL